MLEVHLDLWLDCPVNRVMHGLLFKIDCEHVWLRCSDNGHYVKSFDSVSMEAASRGRYINFSKYKFIPSISNRIISSYKVSKAPRNYYKF